MGTLEGWKKNLFVNICVFLVLCVKNRKGILDELWGVFLLFILVIVEKSWWGGCVCNFDIANHFIIFLVCKIGKKDNPKSLKISILEMILILYYMLFYLFFLCHLGSLLKLNMTQCFFNVFSCGRKHWL